jgi:hypothetical protein
MGARAAMTIGLPRRSSLGQLVVALSLSGMIWLPAARADDSVSECLVGRSAGRVELKPKIDGGACAGFEVRSAKGELIQTFAGWLGSGVLIANNDGSRVVFVQSYPLASLGKGGAVQGTEPGREEVEGVAIFGQSRRLSSFDLNQLVGRPGLVRTSISHVIWVRKAAFEEPTKFVVETTSFRRLMFDVVNAKLVSSEDSAEWKRCPAIVYGRVAKKDKGVMVEDVASIKGDHRKPFPLVRIETPYSTGYQTLCVKQLKDGLEAAEVIPGLRFNQLTER